MANLYDNLQKNADSTKKQDDLLTEVNKRINKALGLRPSKVLLIDDFLNYKIKFVDGQIPVDLLKPCSEKQLISYARQLKKELNCFFDTESQAILDADNILCNCGQND